MKTELVAGPVAGQNVGARENGRTGYWEAARSRLGILRGCLAGLSAVALVTFFALRLNLNLSTSGSLYFLIVVMVSVLWGFWEASVTSLIAVSCLNYFFVPPVFTWTVSDPQNWVALAAFEITALTVSRLSTRAQDEARAEARQRVEVQKLYELSRRILLLDRRRTIGPQIVSLIHEIFGTESVALFDANLARVDAIGFQADDLEQLARSAYFQDSTLQGAGAHTWAHALRLGSKPAGAIALSGPQVGRQLRTAVLDALAHSVKTPLTAILTASSGLLEAGRLSTDDAELAALIDEQAEHLNRLTSELLQMARIDGAEVRLRWERVGVLTLVENVLARYREQLQDRHVAVAESASDLEVYGDRKILAAALEQFIDNASKYSTPGSPISVTAEEDLGEIVIAVHNEGPPIQAADRERIFERFYRAEESRHRASGTGLGLSIAKKAAEAHGGRTWVVSEEATGTTFFFALPRGSRRQDESIARQGSDRG
ncbi:MAG: ATP-binding protein [Candidatus Solibacter sp.]